VETGNTEATVNLATYNITLETSAPCPDDDYEDNDFMWEAKDISEGTYDLYGCYDDTDYFRVTLGDGQTLEATISQVPAGNSSRRLRIADSANNLLQEATGTEDPMTVTWGPVEAGDYLVVADWWRTTAYTLQVDFTGPTAR
jgi:hypothetical protein